MIRLKFLRIERGLSQKQLGDEAKLTASEICLMELGGLIPRSDQLKRLSKALGVPGEQLFEHVADPADGTEARDAQHPEGRRG